MVREVHMAASPTPEPEWFSWLTLLLSPIAGFLGGLAAAWVQVRPILTETRERKIGYLASARSELNTFRDKLDEYYADTRNDLDEGVATFPYIFYWDLSDPSVFSTSQDWSVKFNANEHEKLILFRSNLRSLREYLKPIQKAEKLNSSEAAELCSRLVETSQACGSVITALERLSPLE